MTINARLKLAAGVPAAMAAVISVALLFADHALDDARKHGKDATDIVLEVSEINSLVNSYLLYHEARPKQQLLSQTDTIARILHKVTLHAPEELRLVEEIRQSSEAMRRGFLRLAVDYERYQASDDYNEVLRESEERLAGQILVRAREMVSSAVRLESLVAERTASTQRRVMTFTLTMIIGTTIPVTVLLFAVMRNIATSLRDLRKGTETVAAQDLSFRLNAPGTDELGELAAAFDEMTRRLQETTVSRDALQAEIQERKKAEALLNDAQDRLRRHADELEKIVARRTLKLQETVDELEHFSYAIVHDLRAPLRAMQGFADLIQEEGASRGLSELSHEYLRRIKKASNRMDQLITDALNYSKAAQTEFVLEPVDLHGLVRDLVDTYPNLQKERADIMIEPPLPHVMGSESALTQCLSNLLGNAVKFAKPGIKPLIRIWSEELPAAVDAERSSRKFVRLWVEDNGIGIPKEAQARVFRMFERATTEHEGTGVGLAIVRKVAQRMGGDVGVESEPGNGCRFWVILQSA